MVLAATDMLRLSQIPFSITTWHGQLRHDYGLRKIKTVLVIVHSPCCPVQAEEGLHPVYFTSNNHAKGTKLSDKWLSAACL